MKTVYSNSELPHIFAKQSQPHGRTSNRSMYFEGNKIYSYGDHYCMAHILKGVENTALINSRHYSVTTSQHLGKVSYALTNLNRYSVPNPENINSVNNLDHCKNEFETYLKKQAMALKADYASTLFSLKNVLEFLLKNGKFDASVKKEYKAVLKYMGSTCNNLEKDPISLFKEIKEGEKAKQKAIQLKNAQKIIDWQNGIEARLPNTITDPYLRLSNNKTEIETSHGARVSIKAGLQLWKMIKAGKDIQGHDIDGYRVISINGTLKIGCHNIPRKEVDRMGKILELNK